MTIKASAVGVIGRSEMKQVGEHSLLEFSLACRSGFGDKEKTSWLSCNMWGKRAESLEPHFTKGKALVLFGRMEEQSWEKDGEKRSKMVLTVEDFAFQQGGKNENTGMSNNTKQQAPADEAFDDDIPF